MMMMQAASKGADVMQNMATQRVIGYTKSVSYRKGKKNPKLIQENLNIGIQAWEIGAILLGAAAYEYVNGPGSLVGNLTNGSLVNKDPSAAFNSMPGVKTLFGGK